MKAATFRRGIHPNESKELTRHLKIAEVPLPPRVIIPVRQHIGAPLQPLVKKGDRVKTGQVIADSEAFVASPLHSSVTGVVRSVGNYPTPLSASDSCVEIETEEDEEFAFAPPKNDDYRTLEKSKIIQRIREAGIVGMGGAAFPTGVKFTPPKDIDIDTVIVNGCECEPFLTSDHRLMLEYPEKIITGLKMIMKAVEAERGMVGIETNKPDAIKVMTDLLEDEPSISLRSLKTKYPQGAEKMLIVAATGRKIPPGSLPFHKGVVVSNVGTVTAIYDAVAQKIPLYKRVVTLTGDALKNRGNLMVRIGTPFSFLFEHLGGFSKEVKKIILGGPMMGIAQFESQVGVTKATSGILVEGVKKKKRNKEFNCINCAQCVNHCPMFLMPTRIIRFSRAGMWDKADDYGALNCIECGACSYICPSKIPLVQWIRVAKRRITQINRESGN